MEAEAEGANSNSSRRITRSATATKKKRKFLSDLTNLIPSSTIPKPSIPIPKPYNSNFKPHKPGLNSSKSDSSIGNYNNNKNGPNPSTVPSTPHSSFAVPVNGDGDELELLAVYSRKLIEEKTAVDYGVHKIWENNNIGVVPHITDAIQEWIERVAVVPVAGEDGPADVCVIELGGTIGFNPNQLQDAHQERQIALESYPLARELRRVRFSREKFDEMHARMWWEENRTRIHKQVAACLSCYLLV